jgi:hypothetical protein
MQHEKYKLVAPVTQNMAALENIPRTMMKGKFFLGKRDESPIF